MIIEHFRHHPRNRVGNIKTHSINLLLTNRKLSR